MIEYSIVEKLFAIGFTLVESHWQGLFNTHPVFILWAPISAIVILALEKQDMEEEKNE